MEPMHRRSLVLINKSCDHLNVFYMQGFNEVLSNGDNFNDSNSEAMQETVVQRKDGFFENIQFREYDKEADTRYNNAKAFKIPKKVPAATERRDADDSAGNVAMAVREILKEMEVVPNLPAKVTVDVVAQEDLLIGEEDEELSMEVTEVEVVVME